ncbi:mRNA binding post-transcriptional regulator [Mucor ambiguus]|uniref:mRNA binding post-transcriptional regulator n=1 Tax=Mucor ambiguus TaxID=91626 RepID=A0A0C9M7C8_9FUNG|nr:mRNA binding post-transcriptional regulator [Mucor ambiguus]
MANFLFNNNEMFTNDNLNQNLIIDTSRATLWMGDLDPWMDETFLKQLWLSYGENVIVKLIRDKRTSISCGYAFIGFSSTLSAQKALTTIHGTRIPNSLKTFRLNWASGGGICDRKEDRAPEYSLFVGDLSNDIDETFLLSLFRAKYPSCHSAKIMTDPVTGLSRGYGFVRFLNQLEQQEAVQDMNGIICDSRPIRVSFATPKTNSTHRFDSNQQQQQQQQPQQQQQQNARYFQLALQAPALVHQPTDPNNTTVFVGGLSSPVTEEELGQYFAPFGEVTYVKIPPGKGCGFVQYVSRQSAEHAIERMNGFLIGTSRIRLSWGRSQADKSFSSASTATTTELKSPSTNTTLSSSTNNTNPMLQLSSFRPLSPPSSLLYDHPQSLFRSASTGSVEYHTNSDWLMGITNDHPKDGNSSQYQPKEWHLDDLLY